MDPWQRRAKFIDNEPVKGHRGVRLSLQAGISLPVARTQNREQQQRTNNQQVNQSHHWISDVSRFQYAATSTNEWGKLKATKGEGN
jgi:hypothetical protein